jgi:hypothetical protein
MPLLKIRDDIDLHEELVVKRGYVEVKKEFNNKYINDQYVVQQFLLFGHYYENGDLIVYATEKHYGELSHNGYAEDIDIDNYGLEVYKLALDNLLEVVKGD